MKKHTPGPWFVVEDTEDGPKQHGLSVYSSGNMLVADIIRRGSPWSSVEGMEGDTATARLIAAAPELLAALEGIIAVANVRIDDPRCPVFDHARAAIAKARGEA